MFTFSMCLVAQVRDSAYSIEGVVFDPDLQRPERWATVSIREYNIDVQADSAGRFFIAKLWPGQFTLSTGLLNDIHRITVNLSPSQKKLFVYFSFFRDYAPINSDDIKTPDNWVKINADNKFYFLIPPELEEKKPAGFGDSYFAHYYSEKWHVSFDYGYGGIYSHTLQDGQMKVLLNCRKAIITDFPNPDRSSKYKFVESISFASHPLGLKVEFVDYWQRDEALKILYSIRFP